MTPGENVRPRRGAASGRGTAMTGAGGPHVAALAAPLAEDLLGLEAEVQRVVAQEALRVDGARQLAVVAALEGGQVAGPDLRVALGAVEVDALALAGGVQPLGQRRDGLDATATTARAARGSTRRPGGRVGAAGLGAEVGRPPSCLVACRHRSTSSSASSPTAP